MPKFDLKIRANTGPVSRELLKRAGQVPGATRAAVTAATESLFVRAKMLLTQLIYQKDIPLVTRTRGKDKGKTVPKWRRKMRNGGILGTETFWISSDGTTGTVGTEAGTAPAEPIKNYPQGYAQKVHETRPWRQMAGEQGQNYAMQKFRDKLREELGDK